jgi:catechol 2,3-dioxygenase-like lactoylglutathione lyase family enzyme
VDPLLRKVDCVQIPVPDLDAGLRFYRDGLGLELKWRHATQAGLRLGDSELVLQTERPGPEVDFLVDSAEDATRRVVSLGGALLSGPEDIPVGRVAVVADPFGNPLVLLDLSKGTFRTDPDGNMTGVRS